MVMRFFRKKPKPKNEPTPPPMISIDMTKYATKEDIMRLEEQTRQARIEAIRARLPPSKRAQFDQILERKRRRQR